jgi:protein N-lysine methyltransferase METTL21A
MATNTHSPSSSPETDPLSSLDSFVPARVNKAASTNAVSFGGLLDPALLLHEDLKEGCGGQLWPAGIVLAKYMLCHHKDNLVEKTM